MVTKLTNLGRDIKNSFKSMKWYEWTMMVIMIAVAAFAMVCSFMGKNPITGKTDYNPPWLAVINFISAIAGCVCIFFTAKASIANFIFAIVNTVVYIVYLAYWKVYGTLALETIVYLPMNFISWFIWAKHKDNIEVHLTKSKKMTWWENLLTVAGIAGLTVLTHFLLSELAGSSWANIGSSWGTIEIASHVIELRDVFTWLDSITFAIGMVAIFLECFRFREQYAWWLITDIVAVTLYAIKTPFDPVYFTKKMIYLIMAFVGLVNWIRLQKTRNKENI